MLEIGFTRSGAMSASLQVRLDKLVAYMRCRHQAGAVELHLGNYVKIQQRHAHVATTVRPVRLAMEAFTLSFGAFVLSLLGGNGAWRQRVYGSARASSTQQYGRTNSVHLDIFPWIMRSPCVLLVL